MRCLINFVLALAALAMPLAAHGQTVSPSGLRIDVPVVLKEAKVVFNMDHLVYEGAMPTGLLYMQRMAEDLSLERASWQIIAIFHGPAGYMLLSDAAYDRVRKSTGGNPYRTLIDKLQKVGIRFEECGQTARDNGWVNADLLHGVNSGANFRFVQLAQEGFVQLHP